MAKDREGHSGKELRERKRLGEGHRNQEGTEIIVGVENN